MLAALAVQLVVEQVVVPEAFLPVLGADEQVFGGSAHCGGAGMALWVVMCD